MSLPDLNRNVTSKKLDRLVKEWTTLIAAEVTAAFHAERNSCSVKLQAKYNMVTSLSTDEAQIYFFSEIIRFFLNNGYEKEQVKITQKNGDYYIVIKWYNRMSDEERKDRVNLIKDHMIK